MRQRWSGGNAEAKVAAAIKIIRGNTAPVADGQRDIRAGQHIVLTIRNSVGSTEDNRVPGQPKMIDRGVVGDGGENVERAIDGEMTGVPNKTKRRCGRSEGAERPAIRGSVEKLEAVAIGQRPAEVNVAND